MTIRCRNLTIIGLGKTPDETVLACQRGQSQGADGNFTMLNFICEDLKVQNITFGDYLNVDLDYKVNPRLSRPKRSSVITQGQLAFMEGRRLTAENCRFVSRLNLCPIVGADYSEYRSCHFESTDDALNGNARYEDCDFDIVLTGAGTSEFVGNSLFQALNKKYNYKVKSYASTDLVPSPEDFLSRTKPSVLAWSAWRGQMSKQLLTNCLYLLKWVPLRISWPP